LAPVENQNGYPEINESPQSLNKEQNQDFQKDVIGMRSLSNSFESNKGIS